MKVVIVWQGLTRAYKTELFEQKCKTGISCISCSCFESLSFQSSENMMQLNVSHRFNWQLTECAGYGQYSICLAFSFRSNFYKAKLWQIYQNWLLVSVILQDKVFNSIWVIYIIVKTIYFYISCDHYLTWPRTASIRLATLSPRTVPNCCSVSGHSIYSIRQNIKNRKQ